MYSRMGRWRYGLQSCRQRRLVVRFPRFRACVAGGDRQMHDKRAAAVRLALHRNRAAVRLKDSPNEMQAEPAALDLPRLRLPPSIERLEDVFAVAGIDAEPSIFNGNR